MSDNKKIKILHITQGFLNGNGLETFLKSLFHSLDKDLYENILVIPSEGWNKTVPLIPIEEIGINTLIVLDSLYKIKDLVDNLGIDIIHIHYIGSTSWNRKGILVKLPNGKEVVSCKEKINLDNKPYGYVYISNFWERYKEELDENYNLIPNLDRPKIIITMHCDYRIPLHVWCDTLIHVSNKTASLARCNCISDNKLVIHNGIDINKFKR